MNAIHEATVAIQSANAQLHTNAALMSEATAFINQLKAENERLRAALWKITQEPVEQTKTPLYNLRQIARDALK